MLTCRKNSFRFQVLAALADCVDPMDLPPALCTRAGPRNYRPVHRVAGNTVISMFRWSHQNFYLIRLFPSYRVPIIIRLIILPLPFVIRSTGIGWRLVDSRSPMWSQCWRQQMGSQTRRRHMRWLCCGASGNWSECEWTEEGMRR